MKPPMPIPTDPLEQFVRRNRAAFDTEQPAPVLWDRIAAELDRNAPEVTAPVGITAPVAKPSKRILPMVAMRPGLWQAAATLTVLAGFFWVLGQPVPQGSATATGGQPALNSFSEDLAQADAYYSRAIESKRAEIVALTAYEPELVRDFLKDLDELDRLYTRLGAELPTSANPDVVVAAMIQNLQLRIEVLTRQLGILQKIQQRQPGTTQPAPAAPSRPEVRV
jgi:hypothetical protein